MRKPKDSGWRYYLPDQGETADDATEIRTWAWGNVVDAEDAAERASEDEWDNRDGWESGISAEPIIIVIAPDGSETKWTASREATVVHRVTAA